jgi:hypothetical protein
MQQRLQRLGQHDPGSSDPGIHRIPRMG